MDLVLSCVSYLLVSTSLTIYLFMKKGKEQEEENQILLMALSDQLYQCVLTKSFKDICVCVYIYICVCVLYFLYIYIYIHMVTIDICQDSLQM